MNIRTVTNPIIPAESRATGEARTVAMDISSEDRDAQGRRQDDEPSRDPLNDQEMERALAYFNDLEGFADKGLTVRVEAAGDMRLFLVVDADGQVVRRIPEWEMRPLIQDKDKKTGQIFDKSA